MRIIREVIWDENSKVENNLVNQNCKFLEWQCDMFAGNLFDKHTASPSKTNEVENIEIIVKVKSCGAYIGIAHGFIQSGTMLFALSLFYVHKEYRKYDILVLLLETALKTAINDGGAKRALWTYSSNNETDLHIELLKGLPFCRVSDKLRLFQAETKEFVGHLRKFRQYKPYLLEEHGLSVLKLSDCDKNIKNKLYELEESLNGDNDYLSPFPNKNFDFKWEDRTSYILISNITLEPIGWMLCLQKSEKEIVLSRFYLSKKERTDFKALFFAAYIFDIISSLYERLSFKVVCGNRQMERFVHKVCAPAITNFGRVDCELYIDLDSNIDK